MHDIDRNTPELETKIKDEDEQSDSFLDIFITSIPALNFDAIVLLTNFMTSLTGNTKLAAAFGNMHFFSTFTSHTATMSIAETQGILGAQAHGEKNLKEVNRIFMQSLTLSIVYFGVVGILVGLNIKKLSILMGLNLDDEIMSLAQTGYYWLLLALGFRALTENMKVFLQNESEEIALEIGYWHLGLMIMMVPLTFYVIKVRKIEESSYGLLTLIHEIASFLILWFYIWKRSITNFRFGKLKDIKEGFKEFTIFTLKNFLSICPAYFLGDFAIVFLGWMNLKVDLAVHTLLITISDTIWALSLGYLAVSRTAVNKRIGEGDINLAKKEYSKYLWYGYIIGFSIFIIEIVVHWVLVHFRFYPDIQFGDKLLESYFPYCVFWILNFNVNFYDSVLRSLNQHFLFVYTGILFLAEVMMMYLFVFYYEYAVIAIGLCLTWTAILKTWVNLSVIYFVKWEEALKN